MEERFPEKSLELLNYEVAQRMLEITRRVSDRPYPLSKIQKACVIMKEFTQQLMGIQQ